MTRPRTSPLLTLRGGGQPPATLLLGWLRLSYEGIDPAGAFHYAACAPSLVAWRLQCSDAAACLTCAVPAAGFIGASGWQPLCTAPVRLLQLASADCLQQVEEAHRAAEAALRSARTELARCEHAADELKQARVTLQRLRNPATAPRPSVLSPLPRRVSRR